MAFEDMEEIILENRRQRETAAQTARVIVDEEMVAGLRGRPWRNWARPSAN